MWLHVIVAVAVLCMPGGQLSWPSSMQPWQESASREFQLRVGEYVALHRRIEGPRPRTLIGEVTNLLFLGRAALADELRRGRPLAKQGDIFGREIAAAFRRTIRDAIAEGQLRDVLQIVADAQVRRAPPAISADAPADGSLIAVPPCLVRAFPPLPEELAYRFLGRDLILVDLHAGIVVDYVPDAIPRLT